MERVKVKVAMETLILLFLWCFFFLIMNLATSFPQNQWEF